MAKKDVAPKLSLCQNFQ